jgi:hypothetical protein
MYLLFDLLFDLLCSFLPDQIFHPNVHFRTGDICLDILKQEWSPAWGLQAACRAVLALLSDYDADSPLNCDAGNMVRGGDLAAYHDTAHMYTMENAQFLSWPPVEGVMTPKHNAPNTPSNTTSTDGTGTGTSATTATASTASR